MTQSIKPLADRVIVLPAKQEQKTAAGIIIPDSVKEKPTTGTVISVGKNVDVEVKEGDTVLFSAFAGMPIEVKGEKYMIMRESDIFAVI